MRHHAGSLSSFVASLALFIGLAPVAKADIISNLYDTGVSTNNATLATPGSVDAHYVLSNTPIANPMAYVLQQIPSNYTGNTANSQWIGPSSNSSTEPGGTYTYTTSFTVGSALSSASIQGAVSSDNLVTIYLNGNDEVSETGYGGLSGFSINSGFQSGTNTLTFVVMNYFDGGGNPTALQVSGLSGSYVSAVPVPPSLFLIGAGTLPIMLVSRLRRSRGGQA